MNEDNHFISESFFFLLLKQQENSDRNISVSVNVSQTLHWFKKLNTFRKEYGIHILLLYTQHTILCVPHDSLRALHIVTLDLGLDHSLISFLSGPS